MGIFTDIALIGSLGAGFLGRSQEREAQDRAIDLRLKQEQLAEDLRSTQRTRRLNEVLASQVASAGARGITASSPSLFAISADSINEFAQDENADALNLSFAKIGAATEKRNARDREIFGDIGSVFDAFGPVKEAQFSAGASAAGAGIDQGAVEAGRDALGEPL